MRKTEEEILKKMSLGDQSGVKGLFDLYYQPLCVFALKFFDSIQEAEDIVQDTFVQFWENEKYKSVDTSLKAYLFMSVKNKCLRQLELNKRIYFDDIESLVEVLIAEKRDNSGLEERIKVLNAEIEKLPPKARKVLELIVFKGLKYKEVAEELQISINTVKTQFSRSLKLLRNSLDLILLLMI